MGNSLRLLIVVLLCLGFHSKIHAQSDDLNQILPKVKSNNWQSLIKNELVTINYVYADCHDIVNGIHHENVYLQVINLSPTKVKITWNEQLWYNDKCYGCGDDPDGEFKKTLILDSKETKTGLCSKSSLKELRIFSKMLDFNTKEVLSNFNISNLNISPIN